MTAITVDFDTLAATPDVRLPLTLTAMAPISHGGSMTGNMRMLRTRDVITSQGRKSVPYISGNSLRHELRTALAWHLVGTLDVPGRSLPRRVVSLLWSGGALTTTGAQADLGMVRRVHTTLPSLGLFGYAAQSNIVGGVLWAEDVELVCAENARRMPARLADHPHIDQPCGALKTEVSSFRNDPGRDLANRYIADGDPVTAGTQMIYDMQVLTAGAVMWSGLRLANPTAGHVAAFATAIDTAAPIVDGRRVIHLGGRRVIGYGACALDVDTSHLGDIAALRAAYEDHLRTRRADILSLLTEITG